VRIIQARNPVVFRELVDLYALYFLTPQTAPLVISVFPAPTTNQLVIVFPLTYPLDAQTLVLNFATVASASTVTYNAVNNNFNVTLFSELLQPNWTYTGTIALDAFANEATQQFKNYVGYPERTTIAAGDLLRLIREKCVKPAALSEDDLRNIRCYLKKRAICGQLSIKCVKVSKGKCKKSKKACLLRYFTFVTCCLNAFPVLRKKSSVCDRLQRACCGSEDAHGVFCAIIAILSKCHTSISFDLRILIEMMFEIVVGYNPYCNLAKTSGAFYGLCEKDARIVRGYSREEGVESTVECSEEAESEKKSEDEEKRREGEKKRGVFARYRVLIIVSIAFVAVCGGIAVYSLM